MAVVELEKLQRYFSRDPRVVNATVRKRKKIIKLLIMNSLLNCIRKHYHKPTIIFEDEFLIDTKATKPNKKYIVDMSDKCWATKNFMSFLGYNVFASENSTIISIKRIQDGARNNKIIKKASNNILNKLYPKEHSFAEIQNMVNDEISKLQPVKTVPSVDVEIPSRVSVELYVKYSNVAFGLFGNSKEVKFSVIRFILNKHNKMKMADAEKLITVDPKSYKKMAISVKKKLNELIKSGKI